MIRQRQDDIGLRQEIDVALRRSMKAGQRGDGELADV